MNTELLRVGTTYIPVRNIEKSSEWYTAALGAELSYKDEDKAIINLANQSFFLVKAAPNQQLNFIDDKGREHFALTFEVNGIQQLRTLHAELLEKGINIGEIENRGHTGRNFVFSDPDGNKFDVWSELSRDFIEKYGIRSS
ncbi:VOC family protein [Peribacillus deserti]|uniref:VOC family protein n=1 Tax=Peribacillus deserti TaxID=673318 RepID=A0A2N5M6G8_9BACI|nr:VOC family protein [Peribacillus deserti]PLT29935.1 VOC family protein [Peribacillus deserti]